MGFEEYLIVEKGYKKIKGNKHLSTTIPGGIFNEYKKENKHILFGLNERGKPPVIISPRPIVLQRNLEEKSVYDAGDDGIHRLLKGKSNEEIYNLIWTMKYHYEII